MHEPAGFGGAAGAGGSSRPERHAGDDQVLADAEVREQQDGDRVALGRHPGGGADAALEAQARHAGAGADRSLVRRRSAAAGAEGGLVRSADVVRR